MLPTNIKWWQHAWFLLPCTQLSQTFIIDQNSFFFCFPKMCLQTINFVYLKDFFKVILFTVQHIQSCLFLFMRNGSFHCNDCINHGIEHSQHSIIKITTDILKSCHRTSRDFRDFTKYSGVRENFEVQELFMTFHTNAPVRLWNSKWSLNTSYRLPCTEWWWWTHN